MCGGTHAEHTGRLYPFRLGSESSIATGVRRIEATAGSATVDHLTRSLGVLERVSDSLKATPADVETRLRRLLEQQAELGRRVGALSSLLAHTRTLPEGEQLVLETLRPAGVSVAVVVHELRDHWDDDFLLKRVNYLKQTSPHELHILLSGKRLLCAVHDVSDPKLNAGKVCGLVYLLTFFLSFPSCLSCFSSFRWPPRCCASWGVRGAEAGTLGVASWARPQQHFDQRRG